MESFIKVQKGQNTYQGILLKEDENYLTIKLSSGYNANFKKNNIEILEKKEIEKKAFSKTSVKIEHNLNLPIITLLHTGGTIASKIDYSTGAVSSKFSPEEILSLFPELQEIANIQAKLIGNMASDDMRFEHYNIMLEEIQKAVSEGSKGIIISHGTDTLHYTAAALHYALKNLPIPVILVGAQRSSDRASSDAFSNLQTAVKFIAEQEEQEKKFRRVSICMHNSISDNSFVILDAINAKKMHSSRRDAFKQINFKPLAIIENNKTTFSRDELKTSKPEEKLIISKYDTKLKIGFYKVHPHTFPQEISNLDFYDAIIFEATGLGHIPISQMDDFTKLHPKNLEELKKLISKGKKIVFGVQTVYGQTCLNVYSPGRVLKQTGILGNQLNLTTETLFIRTAHLLSLDKENFEKNWEKNFEGFELNSFDN